MSADHVGLGGGRAQCPGSGSTVSARPRGPARYVPGMRDERVGNSQRTEVIGLLGQALDDGTLALGDYDGRIVAVGISTHTCDLLAQLRDLPPEYGWQPHPAAEPPVSPPLGATPPRPDRAALILGMASLPLSVCFVGGVLGMIAVGLSLRNRPASRAALTGRVLGGIGILLSIGVAAALLLTARRG